MDFAIQGAGNRVIPGQRFRQTSHLICAAPPEQGAQTRLSDREMPDGFEEVQQNHKRHARENKLFQGLHHTK